VRAESRTKLAQVPAMRSTFRASGLTWPETPQALFHLENGLVVRDEVLHHDRSQTVMCLPANQTAPSRESKQVVARSRRRTCAGPHPRTGSPSTWRAGASRLRRDATNAGVVQHEAVIIEDDLREKAVIETLEADHVSSWFMADEGVPLA
jgi:hypothetical protein